MDHDFLGETCFAVISRKSRNSRKRSFSLEFVHRQRKAIIDCDACSGIRDKGMVLSLRTLGIESHETFHVTWTPPHGISCIGGEHIWPKQLISGFCVCPPQKSCYISEPHLPRLLLLASTFKRSFSIRILNVWVSSRVTMSFSALRSTELRCRGSVGIARSLSF